jgi:hypothetical protein
MNLNLWSRALWGALLLFSFGLLFLLYGPTLPDSKAVETYPVFSTAPWPESLAVYLEEFNRQRTNRLSKSRQPEQFLGGTILHQDELAEDGVKVVLTHEGESWTANQKLHYRKDTNSKWITIRAPLQDARVVHILQPANEQRILLVHNKAVSIYNFSSGEKKPLFQGSRLTFSPDRRWAAGYETIDTNGRYALLIVDLDTLQIRKLFTMWEADPGSGTSFHSNWSADGKVLEFYGDVLLVDKLQDTHSAPIRKVRYVYLVEKRELHDLSDAP